SIRVRPGPYHEHLTVDQDVIVEGETNGGLVPTLSPSSVGIPGFAIESGQVQLRNLRFDGYQVAVSIDAADLVVLDSVDVFQQGQGCLASAGITVGSQSSAVGEVRVFRSHLIGAGSNFCEVGGSVGFATAGTVNLVL